MTALHLAPEAELLVLAVRPARSATDDARLLALVERVDWQRVIGMAWEHAVTPMLRSTLRAIGATLPADVEGSLRAAGQGDAVLTMLRTQELTRLIQCFDDAGMDVLAFKGPELALRAYGDVGLRPFVDLDLLLHRPEIPRALALLRSAGYNAPDLALVSETALGTKLKYGNHIGLRLPDPAILVELHWALAAPRFRFGFDLEGIWSRRQHLEIAGRPVPVMSSEDLIVYLFVHAATHRWARLEWIASIAWLITRTPDLNWSLVRQYAAEMHVLRVVQIGMRLVRDFLGVPTPGQMEPIGSEVGAVDRMSREVIPYLFPAPDEPPPPTSSFASWRQLMRMRERRIDRLSMFAAALSVPTEEDVEWVTLPRPLWPVYRVLRPVRLLTAS